MSTQLKRQFYAVSFAMVVVQIGCLLLIFAGALRSGAVSFRHFAQFWVASALVGLICAMLGDGGLTKQRSVSLGVLGFVLNGGFLALLGILYMASVMHD